MRRWTFIFVVLSLLLSGCQPIVAPADLAGLEVSQRSGTVMGDVDFAVPDWGLAEGWAHFEVEQIDDEQETAQGMVRWVEYNDAGELRYVVAEPGCIAFGPDGHTAMIAVQIDHRYGWGEGESGQWMQFWVNDAGVDGQLVIASPLFPPANENPGCELKTPEFQITAVGGDLTVGASGGSPQTDSDMTEQAIMARYIGELWNQGNLAVADGLIADTFVSHNRPAGEGLDFAKEMVAGFRAENPDAYFTIDDVLPTDEGAILVITMMIRPEGAASDAEGQPAGEPMMVRLALHDNQITDRWLYVADE